MNIITDIMTRDRRTISWSNEISYPKDTIITRKGNLFISLINENKGNDPLTTKYWKSIL